MLQNTPAQHVLLFFWVGFLNRVQNVIIHPQDQADLQKMGWGGFDVKNPSLRHSFIHCAILIHEYYTHN